MADYFPYPSANNQSIVDLMQWSNGVSEGAFGIMILIMIFTISFLSLKDYPSERIFPASSFITAMSSYFLYVLGVIDGALVVVTTIMFVSSVFFLMRGET